MLSVMPSSSRFTSTLFIAMMIVASVFCARAQEPSGPHKTPHVDDWTHHHLVFSDPGTREDAIRNGSLQKWIAVTNSPRFKMQQAKRSMGTLPVALNSENGAGGDSRGGHRNPHQPSPAMTTIEKDWSQPLGGVAGTSLTITIATPTTSNIGNTSVFTIDGVDFDASAPTTEKGVITFSGSAPSTGGCDAGTAATINAIQGLQKNP